MQVTGKPFVRKFVETLPNVEMKGKEQHEILDNLIRQTIVNDSFLSFTKAGENPVQWIHWLDAIDHQNTNKSLKNSKLERGVDAKDSKLEEVPGSEVMTGEGPGIRDSLHSSMKGSNMFGRGLPTSGDRLHSLKLPEAMVAIAQVAAKATDMPGWPLMSNKMQMQKCEKCSQEFCSPLNHRRHMRMTHRRSLHVDKEDLKRKKEQLAAYWDKLTPEEACEIVSFKKISLEDLSGASIVRALSTHLQQPGLLSLPQSYIKAATALLDIVQSKPSRFPLHSEMLFSILEDASEKNLLGGVTSTSVQRCFFDSEPGKVGLETKNLLASLGFLVELRLVKAWMDDKDVEALRCQKALVEEEEAAQKKRAKLQERKRQKKMRQKESRDKERKGNESLCGFPRLKFEAFSGAGHAEGEDSPTATQSSPSSSGYSGQEPNHLESFPMDLDDFEGFNDCKTKDQNRQLAAEQRGMHGDADDGQDGCWLDSDILFRSQPPTSDEVDAFQAGSLVTDGEGSLQLSGHGGSQDPELQNSFPDLREENGRLFLQFKTPNGKFIPERKIEGRGWRERRQNDTNDYSSYQKQPYNYDRRYYDYSYGTQKVLRKPQNVAGNSAPELLGASMGSKWNAPPRYGQYREKYTGIRRPSPTASSGHAVWTRKVPQNPASESDRSDERAEPSDVGVVNDSSEIAHNSQLEHLPPEDACVDASNSTVSDTCNGTCSPDTCPAHPEKSGGGLSRDSSISFDSVISHSSTSVSARVGAEEQASNEGSRMPPNFSTQALSEPVPGVNDKEAGEELHITSGAVVVGSLRISLGDAWSNVAEHLSFDNKSLEMLNHPSGEAKNLWGKKRKGEVQEVSEPLPGDQNASPDLPCSVGAEAGLNVSSNPLHEIGISSPDVSRATSLNVKEAQFHQTVAGEENLRQINPLSEKLVKQGQWSSSLNKLGTIKVWRPVAVGERSEPLVAGSFSESETVTEQEPDATNSSATICSEADDTSCPDPIIDHFSRSHPLTQSSNEHAGSLSHIGNPQVGEYQAIADRSCSEGFELTPVTLDALETYASHEESSSQHCRLEDGTEPSTSGGKWKSLPFADIASFLSQRWADAIASSDSIDLAMHLRESEDSLAESTSQNLSPPLSTDDISSQCLQDENKHLHTADHGSGSDAEDARCTAGLSLKVSVLAQNPSRM